MVQNKIQDITFNKYSHFQSVKHTIKVFYDKVTNSFCEWIIDTEIEVEIAVFVVDPDQQQRQDRSWGGGRECREFSELHWLESDDMRVGGRRQQDVLCSCVRTGATSGAAGDILTFITIHINQQGSSAQLSREYGSFR